MGNICLDNLMERECGGLGNYDPSRVELVFDTNAWKYRYGRTEKAVVVTGGVVEELERYPDVFPEESIRDTALILNPRIIAHMISRDSERAILEATKHYKKSGRKNHNRDIGWVDAQQIGYAMERAQRDRKTVLVSNDDDILGAVKWLRKRFDHIGESVVAVSVQRYIERLHPHLLDGLSKSAKRDVFATIEAGYKVAA